MPVLSWVSPLSWLTRGGGLTLPPGLWVMHRAQTYVTLLIVSRNSFPVKSRKTIINIASLPREFYSPLTIFHWSETYEQFLIYVPPAIRSLSPSLSVSQFSLEVKYPSIMLEGVRDGARTVWLWASGLLPLLPHLPCGFLGNFENFPFGACGSE